MTATIDGVAWTATTSVTATISTGVLSIAGVNPTYNLAFTVAGAGVPGTYAIPGAAGGLQVGNNALLSLTPSGVAPSSWAADFTKGSGTVVVTASTGTSVTGTFSFVLNAVQGTAATGTKSVTNGAFNINF